MTSSTTTLERRRQAAMRQRRKRARRKRDERVFRIPADEVMLSIALINARLMPVDSGDDIAAMERALAEIIRDFVHSHA